MALPCNATPHSLQEASPRGSPEHRGATEWSEDTDTPTDIAEEAPIWGREGVTAAGAGGSLQWGLGGHPGTQGYLRRAMIFLKDRFFFKMNSRNLVINFTITL